jgi:hypothetical protein
MLPITEVPQTIASGMANYRDVFCRDEGFEHVSRYVTGLIISPNKTLQGIYDWQICSLRSLTPSAYRDDEKPSRRAMHEAVFENGWNSEALMPQHREVVAEDHRGRGREVISVDWTFAHHDKGKEIYGVKRGYDYVEKRTSQFQTVMTAVISNSLLIDGLDVVVQEPNWQEEEIEYLKATAKDSYEQMEAAQQRLLELLHYWKNRRQYKKRTELALEMVQQIENEEKFAQANYAFDNSVLSLKLTQFIEDCGKHWVSELECSRNIQWHGQWVRVDQVATELREQHPESFRHKKVRCRNEETKNFWAFTKVVRLKKYGRKRLVIVHETENLTDTPRFLLTDARHWESARIIQTWSYRWASEIFHEFTKQVTGLESAQVRKCAKPSRAAGEEAVKRHFRLSCVSQSILQRAPAIGSESERFEFAKGKITFGQKCRTIAREIFRSLLQRIKQMFIKGKDCNQILEVLMPA